MIMLHSANGATSTATLRLVGRRCLEEGFVQDLSLYFKTFFYQHL